MITGCPHISCNLRAINLPNVSVGPPAGKGTIILTGPFGKSVASEVVAELAAKVQVLENKKFALKTTIDKTRQGLEGFTVFMVLVTRLNVISLDESGVITSFFVH